MFILNFDDIPPISDVSDVSDVSDIPSISVHISDISPS